MKNLVFISILSIVLSVFLWSCDEAFLDQDKPLVSTEALIYTNAGKTEMALLGLYYSLKGTSSTDYHCSFMGGRTYIAFDARGEDIINKDPNLITVYNTYRMQVDLRSDENNDAWYCGYLAINRANVFIESIEEYKTAEVIGDNLAKQYVAEAKFLRAMSYYYLLQLYSEPYKVNKAAKAIPLRLTAIKGSGSSDCPSSTNAKIYEAILKDLSDNEIAALPNDAKIKTRATKAAAYMLKMRVYMAMENWTEAIKAGEAVTGYSLVSDVTAQFKTPYTTNESIFTLPQSNNDRPSTQRGAVAYYSTGNILVIDKENGVMSLPNYSLAKDKRAAFNNDGKLVKYTDVLNWIPIFRYAETKLNLAECYARNNNESAAKTALSDVRRRSIAAADDPLDVSALSGSALMDAITFEKRLEFIGEGMRGIEIIRKGESFIKGGGINVSPGNPFYTWPIPDAEIVNNSKWNELEP